MYEWPTITAPSLYCLFSHERWLLLSMLSTKVRYWPHNGSEGSQNPSDSLRITLSKIMLHPLNLFLFEESIRASDILCQVFCIGSGKINGHSITRLRLEK